MRPDTVSAVMYAGYRDRIDPLRRELRRIGIVEWREHIVTDTPFDKVLMAAVPHVRKLDDVPGLFTGVMGHYRAISEAFSLGAKSAMFVEDDCRFLNDVQSVWSTLDMVPAEWDFLALDTFLHKKSEPVEGGWSKCGFWRSAACYILGRKAMRRLLDVIGSCVSGGPAMRGIDTYFDIGFIGNDMKCFIADPNLAIQQKCPGASLSGTFEKYSGIGVDTTLYARF